MTYYDRYGNACCYTDKTNHIYALDGKPLGYILDNSVWNYGGRYLGQFKNSWIIDREGYYLFFSDESKGGPIKPIRKLTPLNSIQELRPIKSIREIPPIPPITSLYWSETDINSFFLL